MAEQLLAYGWQHRASSREIKYFSKADVESITGKLGKGPQPMAAALDVRASRRQRRQRGAGGDKQQQGNSEPRHFSQKVNIGTLLTVQLGRCPLRI
jgi:hypothetical protein